MAPEGPASEHRYPWRAIRADYLRAGVGLAVTVPPLIFAPGGPWVRLLLGALAALFAWLGARAWWRRRTRLRMDAGGVSRGPRRISWDTLTGLKLRRFGGRKRPGSGWVEMRLEGPGARIALDSEITGFLAIARAAAAAAEANGLALDARTVAGLAALGLSYGQADQAPRR